MELHLIRMMKEFSVVTYSSGCLMKYHDSIKQSQKKMSLSIQLLTQWNLPTTPVNYAVAYDFIHAKNAELVAAIEHRIASTLPIDDYFSDEIHQEYILGQGKFRDELIDDINDVVNNVDSISSSSSTAMQGFVQQLNHNLAKISSEDVTLAKNAINDLQQASSIFTKHQSKLKQKMAHARSQTALLREELNEIRKEIYSDPLTHLYNRKAMSKYLETWYGENDKQQIAAIIINIDNFPHITQKFGPLLSNVLLSKVADKVTSYVDNSGLPIRSTSDEFLILLPEVEPNATREIAEKIRQGVDKLRFVSTKSGIKLPKMTISLGVSEFTITKNIHQVIDNARNALTLSENKAFNQVEI